jgi:hypothetical protein
MSHFNCKIKYRTNSFLNKAKPKAIFYQYFIEQHSDINNSKCYSKRVETSKIKAMKTYRFRKTLNYCSHPNASEAQNTDRGQLPNLFIIGTTQIDISGFLNRNRYPCETEDFKETKAGWVVHLPTGIKYKIESDATPSYSVYGSTSGTRNIFMTVMAPDGTIFYSSGVEIQAIN